MGGNLRVPIDKVVFVDIHHYLACQEQDKYQVARYIGKLNQLLKEEHVLLMGPGRWGSTTPSLGVPVHFTEISNMIAMCEISYQSEGLMPELSYGSHFFQDLVEAGVFILLFLRSRQGFSSMKNSCREKIFWRLCCRRPQRLRRCSGLWM